jgi:hypothetical protein
MNKALVLLALLLGPLYAQQGNAVRVSVGPPPDAFESIIYYSGTSPVTICKALSKVADSTITVSAASNAAAVSFTATAHNLGDFANGSIFHPLVKITGGTGNWTAVNGVWRATPTSADAFTIAVNSSGFGALTGTLVVTTQAPRLNAPVWSIGTFVYDGSSNLVGLSWAAGPSTSTSIGAGVTILNGGSTGLAFACSAKANRGDQ